MDTCDRRTGNVIYKRPKPGMLIRCTFCWTPLNSFVYLFADSVLSVWTGGYCCREEKVAILACVVEGGYHSLSQYQWYKDGRSLSDEHYPIMYANQCGTYRCDVLVQDSDAKQFTFTVEGANSELVLFDSISCLLY